jgi:hypothetical protein
MKQDPAPLDTTTRVEFQVRFSVRARRQRRAESPVQAVPPEPIEPNPAPRIVAPTQRVPKLARLLVLAHHFERLVRDGVVKDYATIARLTGLTRARVTQIVNLTLLAPDIQEHLLFPSPAWPSQESLLEYHLRSLSGVVDWDAQRSAIGARPASPRR